MDKANELFSKFGEAFETVYKRELQEDDDWVLVLHLVHGYDKSGHSKKGYIVCSEGTYLDHDLLEDNGFYEKQFSCTGTGKVGRYNRNTRQFVPSTIPRF